MKWKCSAIIKSWSIAVKHKWFELTYSRVIDQNFKDECQSHFNNRKIQHCYYNKSFDAKKRLWKIRQINEYFNKLWRQCQLSIDC